MDLFAPPSEEERAALEVPHQQENTGLFSPPSKEEIAQHGLYDGGKISPLQTFQEQAAQGASAGYIPELTGAFAKGYEGATGKDIGGYVQTRDDTAQRLNESREQNPISGLAGNIAGTVLLSAAMPGLGAESVAQRITAAGAKGLARGAIQNPGRTEGEVAPLQLEERGKNAIAGGTYAIATQGLGEMASGILSKFKKNPLDFIPNPYLRKGANYLADKIGIGSAAEEQPFGWRSIQSYRSPVSDFSKASSSFSTAPGALEQQYQLRKKIFGGPQ